MLALSFVPFSIESVSLLSSSESWRIWSYAKDNENNKFISSTIEDSEPEWLVFVPFRGLVSGSVARAVLGVDGGTNKRERVKKMRD